jgi:putative Holliday junction resolvase
MDGTEQDITHAARKFGRQLHGRFQLPVYEMDERLSSREAEAEISRQRAAGQRKKSRKGDVDKMAAQIILQSWIQQQEHLKHERSE